MNILPLISPHIYILFSKSSYIFPKQDSNPWWTRVSAVTIGSYKKITKSWKANAEADCGCNYILKKLVTN